MSLPRLTAEQEIEAKHLEAKINDAIAKEVADLARLLVGTGEKDLFGATEFQVRDLVLRIGARAYSEHLREKKKRLPRMLRPLPRVRADSRVSRLQTAQSLEHPGTHSRSPCLLLLPSLRWTIPLG